MTGPEISSKVMALYKARREEQQRLMAEYERTIFNPQLEALRDQCQHVAHKELQSNG